MITIFDEQQVMDAYSHEVYNEGKNDGIVDGIVKGKEQQAKETAYELRSMGMSDDNIARAVKVSVATVSKWLSEPHAASAT